MKGPGLKSPLPPAAVHDAAADWVAREEAGRLSAVDLARLERWLSADARHRAAYEDACRVSKVAARHAADPAIMAMRSAALSYRGDTSGPLWRTAIAVAAIIAAVGVGWAALSAYPPAAVRIAEVSAPIARLAPEPDANVALYRTAVGERLTVTLPDGSTATLNTDSTLKIAYSKAERRVHLLRGQALFEVAKNPHRPFQVYAGDRLITAVGTVFDVRLQGEKVKVALVEGVVRVARSVPGASGGAPLQQVTITEGELLEASLSAPVVVRTIDVNSFTSWRSGVLVFDDVPLNDAVAEINRYTKYPVTVADASLNNLRVSGVFKAGDPNRFVSAMTELFPIEAGYAQDGGRVLRADVR